MMFFFMSLGLYFWWISLSNSVSLLMVLVFSVVSVMYYSFSIEMKIPLFMVVLTLSGGLFVLISFVIMFVPSDYKMGVINFRNGTCLILLFLSLSLFFSFKNDNVLFSGNYLIDWSEIKVWGNFIFVYFFLIILLFLFLFVMNCIVNSSTGSMFSKKKSKGMG